MESPMNTLLSPSPTVNGQVDVTLPPQLVSTLTLRSWALPGWYASPLTVPLTAGASMQSAVDLWSHSTPAGKPVRGRTCADAVTDAEVIVRVRARPARAAAILAQRLIG